MSYVGLDLGKMRDPPAVVVVERIEHRRAFQGTEFEKLVVRFTEVMPLGTGDCAIGRTGGPMRFGRGCHRGGGSGGRYAAGGAA
jgi:hypothetical protein